MRKSRTGKRKRKDKITWGKLLSKGEQEKLFEYLTIPLQGFNGEVVKKIYLCMFKAIQDYLICEILLFTGIRARELCHLRVKDTPFVLDEDVIDIYRGKGDRDRSIQIHKDLAKEIRVYITKYRAKTMPRHIIRTDYSKPLFYNRQGRPLTPNSLYRKIRTIGEKAGITKRLHPHIFRHTFAVNALLNGVDIYLLQELMGHSDITVTAKYLHIVNTQLTGLGDKLRGPFRAQIQPRFKW